jgi:hypothetical protein
MFNGFDICNKRSYKKAVSTNKGAYKIIIEPMSNRGFLFGKPDSGIKGHMQEKLTWNIGANWESLGLDSLITSLVPNSMVTAGGSFQKLANVSVTNSGVATRKYYTKGSYLVINPTFRVVDYDDSNAPLKACLFMTGMCLPRKEMGASINDLMSSLNEESKLSKLKNLLRGGMSEQTLTELDRGNVLDKAIGTFGKALKSGLSDMGSSEINLTDGPSPVNVEIGHWFKMSNMVIEQVDINLSDEMTAVGPRYADITVQLSSREELLVESDGINTLMLGATKSRVTIG